MTGTAIVEQIIEILVSGLTGIGQGIGEGIMAMVQALFFTTPSGGTTTLSVFAVLIVVFAAISLGLSLTRWVLNFLTSWGNKAN